MIDLEDDVDLTDEERERRKAQPDSVGTPLAPIATESSKLPDTLSQSSMQPEAIGEPLKLAPGPAQRPASERYQELSAQQPKPWHDLGVGGKIGRVAESIGTAINPNIVAAIPGTEQHHQRELGQARTAAEEENRTITNQSEEQLRGAQADEQRALAAKNARPTPEKFENITQLHAHAVQDAINRGVDPSADPRVLQVEDAIQRVQKQAAPKPDTATQEDQKFEDITARSHMGKPVSAEEKAWAAAYQQRKTIGPAFTANAANDRQTRTFDQQEKMFHLREQALSAATKTMIESAPTVDGLASRIDPLIDQLDGELGPGSGRWSEFWAGKVGTKNPAYSKLRTDVSLLQTALMRMHVGARGGGEMMAHFKDIIDQGKQDPDNMRAALSEIRQYVHDLKAKGAAGGMSPAVLNSEAPPSGAAAPAAGGGFAKWKSTQKP